MIDINIKELIIFALIITVIDSVWLRSYMLPKYTQWFDSIGVSMEIDRTAILLAYLLMVLVYPLLIKDNDRETELVRAACVGAAIFGLYGFTVAAIFPKYDLKFALTELVWGVVLYTSTTFIKQKITS